MNLQRVQSGLDEAADGHLTISQSFCCPPRSWNIPSAEKYVSQSEKNQLLIPPEPLRAKSQAVLLVEAAAAAVSSAGTAGELSNPGVATFCTVATGCLRAWVQTGLRAHQKT